MSEPTPTALPAMPSTVATGREPDNDGPPVFASDWGKPKPTPAPKNAAKPIVQQDKSVPPRRPIVKPEPKPTPVKPRPKTVPSNTAAELKKPRPNSRAAGTDVGRGGSEPELVAIAIIVVLLVVVFVVVVIYLVGTKPGASSAAHSEPAVAPPTPFHSSDPGLRQLAAGDCVNRQSDESSVTPAVCGTSSATNRVALVTDDRANCAHGQVSVRSTGPSPAVLCLAPAPDP
jgi:outer membrane biosynthesis protein TonB